MNLKFSKILTVLFISCVVALLYNYFDPNGLKIIREERILNWESDSLLNKTIDVTINLNKQDSIPRNTLSNINNLKDLTHDVKDFTEPKTIKLKFALQLYNEGKKFIDARPVEEYEENHIKGAINIPFYGSEKYESVLDKIPKDEVIVTYCSGEDCDLSILLADELFGKGYKKIYVFFGGWNFWLQSGYPTEKVNEEKIIFK